MSRKITNENLDKFGKEIVEASEMLQVATLSLRSLYVFNSSSVDSFVRLRQKITNNAKIYSEKILPISNDLIRIIRSFFDFYYYSNVNVFKKYHKLFSDEVNRGAEACNLTLELNKQILVEFKNNEDEVIEVLEQLKSKAKEFEQKKKKLTKSADTKLNWAIGLALIPVVNVIASPILYVNGSKSIENAIAESEEELLTVAAAEAIRGPLITSITNLVSIFNNIARFFIVLTDELTNIDDDDSRTMHFDMMKNKSKIIIDACKHYFNNIPAIMANLQAIPNDYDENYVKEWLSDRS
jgi:hypothetical protein